METGRGLKPVLRIPFGLLGALVLIVAAEAAVARCSRYLLPSHTLGYRFATAAVSEAAGNDVLCLGDSLVKFGVLPQVLAGRNTKVYNLACPAAHPPMTYFLLQRVLDSGARPAAILVDFKPTLAQPDPFEAIESLSEVLTRRECLDLLLTSKEPAAVGRLMAHRWIPSLNARKGIRAWGASLVLGRPRPSVHVKEPEWLANWQANRGAWVVDKNPNAGRTELFPDEGIAQLLGAWSCHPTSLTYIERFLDVADRAGVRVYWLVPPVAPRLQRQREQRGDDRRFTRFLQSLSERHPDLVVVDARRSGYPTSTFIDGSHLDVEGAYHYTLELAKVLQEHQRSDSPPRWVSVREYRARPVKRALADRRESPPLRE